MWKVAERGRVAHLLIGGNPVCGAQGTKWRVVAGVARCPECDQPPPATSLPAYLPNRDAGAVEYPDGDNEVPLWVPMTSRQDNVQEDRL